MRRIASAILLNIALIAAQLVVGPEIGAGHSIGAANASARASVQYAASNDWPQLQHDPQRSGHTPEEVRPPFVYLWKWNEVPFASRTQPVVTGGRLFIGGLDGVMYARDAQTGAPLWTFSTGGPIRHSAAVHDNRLIFGSHDGSVYALDVATGALIWRREAGSGIATAPAVADDSVYIGSTDGVFYALDADDGGVRWARDVGAPILTSAALNPDASVVYFGAENVRAYALDAANGSIRWQTQLRGQSLADRWPVVVGDLVIYRSQSLYYFHRLLHEGDDAMDEAGPYSGHTLDPAVWAADWARVRPKIVSYLTTRPDRQTFFALEASTGHLRAVAPVLYTYGNGDAPAPPVARGGDIYLVYRPRHGIQTDSDSVHVSSLYNAELGRMAATTLDITGLTLAPGEIWNRHFRATSDEPAPLSMGGTMLFVDNWERLGGIDVASGELFEVANVADDWPDCNGDCQAKSGPMPFYDSYPFPGPEIGEGSQRSGAVIAEGAIYWRVREAGLAAIGHADGTQAQTYLWPADETEQQGSLVTQVEQLPEMMDTHIASPPPLSDYVWTPVVRPVPFPPRDLVERLEEAIEPVMSAGHLIPFFLERGFTSPQAIPGDSAHPEDGLCSFNPGNVYWFDPGELVYTLSIAYPYLSPGLQSQVRSYLQAEMERYPPLERLPYPGSASWLVNGTRRETYPVTILPNNWPPPAPPLETLYALWTYAEATGDWAYLQQRWSAIDALFDARKNQVDSYARIAGAIGYARIASHLGHSTAAQEGANVAVSAMAAGTNFATFLSRANGRYPDARPNSYEGTRAPVFYGLTPDVGRYLQDYVGPTVEAYLDAFTARYDGDYLWYLTRLGAQVDPGESSFHGPELAWSIFLAKAYARNTSGWQLRPYLDRPWGLGDLYYIQKLVATIEADSTPNLSYSIKTASPGGPEYGDRVNYAVQLRNFGGPMTRTLTVTDRIPSGVSYVPGSLTATLGTPARDGDLILWSEILSDTREVDITYAVVVETQDTQAIRSTVTIDASPFGIFERTATFIANGYHHFLPTVMRRSW